MSIIFQRVQFKSCFHVEVVPSEGVFILSENDEVLLRGETYVRLAPLLNGQRSIKEICEFFQGQISAPEVYYAIELLKREGYVVEATTSLPAEQAAFWQMLDVDADVAATRLEQTPVSVLSFGQIDPAPFKAMLQSFGVRLADEGQFRIVLTDNYLQPGLRAWNQEALARQQPWMLVKPVGTELWLGPIFKPGQTGCWACLTHRLQEHRKIEYFLQEKRDRSTRFTTSLSALPSTWQTALSMAATESAKWLVTGKNEALEGQVVTLNALSLQKETHVLVRRPQCPSCGDASLLATASSAPLRLQSRPKFFTHDGGHRVYSPEETFKKFEHHISRITGLVDKLKPLSSQGKATPLITSYVANHHSVSIKDVIDFWRPELQEQAGGKGKSLMQAKASVLCEALERYSGVFQGDEARVSAKFNALGAAAIHPNDCMRFSEQQFENRRRHNQKNTRLNWYPQRFDEEMEIEWSPVWSLTHDEPRYLATAFCYYAYHGNYKSDFAYGDSNGCAAGNTLEEAILQGFMELVERDSVALWWYNRLKKPAVDLASFDDPYYEQLQHYYNTQQRDLWVLDVTSDFNIPSFVAISRRHDQKEEEIVLGFGAHFDPQIGLLRAVTELNQLLSPTFAAQDQAAEKKQEKNGWFNSATIASQPHLVPDDKRPPKRLADYPKQWSDDLYTDVMTCVKIAKEKGLETLVLNQTRPDVGLHVVKVVVPGMRHYWERFAPGRLYDVPVQMGWLTDPLTEEQLNPEWVYS